MYVGHTTAAKHIVDSQVIIVLCRIMFTGFVLRCRINLKQQPLGTGHRTSVTAAIQVSYQAALEVPRWADGHLALIVAAKQTTHLERTAAGIRESQVDAHL